MFACCAVGLKRVSIWSARDIGAGSPGFWANPAAIQAFFYLLASSLIAYHVSEGKCFIYSYMTLSLSVAGSVWRADMIVPLLLIPADCIYSSQYFQPSFFVASSASSGFGETVLLLSLASYKFSLLLKFLTRCLIFEAPSWGRYMVRVWPRRFAI